MRTVVCCLALLGAALAGEAEPPKASTQFGAQRLDFALGGNRAFLIQPTKAAPDGSKPWLWYAPTFIGRHPDPSHAWMFELLLAQGFAICGIEVGESYGSPKGRAAYTALYEHVTTTYGLAPKACLLPQSRGGLMCDLASYPGLGRACGAYGLTEAELKGRLKEHNPIERLAPLAKAKVPILHLHGDSDKVVPLEANAGELVRRYRALGGSAELIVIKGKGHQVCDEFFRSPRLVAFFLSLGRLPGNGANALLHSTPP